MVAFLLLNSHRKVSTCIFVVVVVVCSHGVLKMGIPSSETYWCIKLLTISFL